MTDHAPGVRRGTAGLVLLAGVFLAIIGGSVGVIVGLRTDKGTNDLGSPGGTATTVPPVSTASPATTKPGGGPGTTSPSPAAPERCLDHSERLAKAAGSPGDLVVHAYYRTAQSEVWICRDSAGKLWYQGHSGGPPDREIVEGEDGLFLADVRRADGGYVATNRSQDGRTEYHVDRTRLRILGFPSNSVIEQAVVEHRGGGA